MNIPNILTLIRIAAIAPFLYFYLFVPKYGEFIALLIFVFTGITDVLDGYYARKHNQVTKIGTMLDPLADKMLLIAVLTVFTLKEKIELWILAILFFKELSMILFAYNLFNKKGEVIPSNVLGKASTVIFYIASIFIIVDFSLGSSLINIFILMSILSMFFYFIKYITI